MKAPGVDVVLFDLGGVLVELAGIGQMMAWCPHLPDVGTLWQRWLALARGAPLRDRRRDAARVRGRHGRRVRPAGRRRRRSSRRSARGRRACCRRQPRAPRRAARPLHDSRACRTRTRSTGRACATNGRCDRHVPPQLPVAPGRRAEARRRVLRARARALGTPAARVLFVDDNAINVEAAARLGIVARDIARTSGAAPKVRRVSIGSTPASTLG